MRIKLTPVDCLTNAPEILAVWPAIVFTRKHQHESLHVGKEMSDVCREILDVYEFLNYFMFVCKLIAFL